MSNQEAPTAEETMENAKELVQMLDTSVNPQIAGSDDFMFLQNKIYNSIHSLKLLLCLCESQAKTIQELEAELAYLKKLYVNNDYYSDAPPPSNK